MVKKVSSIFLAVLLIFTLSSCTSEDGVHKLSDYEYLENAYDEYDTVLIKYNGTDPKIIVPMGNAFLSDTFANNQYIEKIYVQDGGGNVPSHAFEGCTNLRIANIGAEAIGKDAFKDCVNLENLGLYYPVSAEAFIECSNLVEVYPYGDTSLLYSSMKNGCLYTSSSAKNPGVVIIGTTGVINNEIVTEIANYAYYGRNALTNLIISEYITNIGECAFGKNVNLERISVDANNKVYDSRDDSNAIIETNSNKLIFGCKNTMIPNDIQSIAKNAFVGCGLTGINIPIGIKSIDPKSFVECYDVTNVSVSVNNLTYDSRENCNGIIHTASNKLVLAFNTTNIPSSVTSIGSYAYSNSNVENLVIPETVTSIDDYAFADMKNLKSITIPASITSLNPTMFEGCDNLETIIVDGNNPVYDSRDNSNAIIETATDKLVCATKYTTIPDTVKIIGAHSFEDFDNITSINLPSSVVEIEDYAFASCEGLTEIIIPDTLKIIGAYAFADCSNVRNVTISDSVETIKDCAFLNLNKVEVIKIPNSVTSIGVKAFAGWTNLINISVDPSNPVYYSINNSEIVERATDSLVLGSPHTIIDSTIKNVKAYAFYGSKLKKLTIPATLTSFEEGAFAGCSYLAEIIVDPNNPIYEVKQNAIIEKATNKLVVGCKNSKIDGSVTIIGAHAFDGVSTYEVVIPESVDTIEEYAFANNDVLIRLAVSKKLNVVKSHAFANCNEFYIECYSLWSNVNYKNFADDWKN